MRYNKSFYLSFCVRYRPRRGPRFRTWAPRSTADTRRCRWGGPVLPSRDRLQWHADQFGPNL